MLSHIRNFRVVAVCVLVFACVLGWRVNEWFMGLGVPTIEQAAYAGATLALVFGVAKYWTTTKAHTGD